MSELTCDFPTEHTLMQQLGGSENADEINHIVQRYEPLIHKWCRGHCAQRADADDVCQAIMLNMIQKLRHFKYDPERGNFRAWLRRVTRNAWLDYVRKCKREVQIAGNTADHLWMVNVKDDALEHALGDMFAKELVWAAIHMARQQTCERSWQVFHGFVFRNLSALEIAAECNISPGSTYVLKSRFQKQLTAALEVLDRPDGKA